eukprot:5238416-Alexandrium_andersonii.AAC.1
MSASLVGSEMCIRDRFRVRSAGAASSGENPWLDSGTDAGQDPWRGTAYPVSYTHLTLPTICSV